MSYVPDEVWPENKSSKKLVDGISKCQALDDIHVMKNGASTDWIPLNKTSYPQPRRITWSVCVGDCFRDETSNCELRRLFSMFQSYRQLGDCTVRPMPREIFQLGVHLWHVAYPHLSAISRVCPPTGCQLLMYHSQFGTSGGKIGFHQDVGFKSGTSQIRGSSVMIFSTGCPMLFELKTACKKNRADNTIPSSKEQLRVVLHHGDLLVLDPTDDETYMHGVDSNALKKGQRTLGAVLSFVGCRRLKHITVTLHINTNDTMVLTSSNPLGYRNHCQNLNNRKRKEADLLHPLRLKRGENRQLRKGRQTL